MSKICKMSKIDLLIGKITLTLGDQVTLTILYCQYYPLNWFKKLCANLTKEN